MDLLDRRQWAAWALLGDPLETLPKPLTEIARRIEQALSEYEMAAHRRSKVAEDDLLEDVMVWLKLGIPAPLTDKTDPAVSCWTKQQCIELNDKIQAAILR